VSRVAARPARAGPTDSSAHGETLDLLGEGGLAGAGIHTAGEAAHRQPDPHKLAADRGIITPAFVTGMGVASTSASSLDMRRCLRGAAPGSRSPFQHGTDRSSHQQVAVAELGGIRGHMPFAATPPRAHVEAHAPLASRNLCQSLLSLRVARQRSLPIAVEVLASTSPLARAPRGRWNSSSMTTTLHGSGAGPACSRCCCARA
jgi:hypothetical protein